MDNEILKKRLQLLRGNASYEAFGECCELSKDAIRRYEQGKRKPTLEAAVKIADYCDVSLDWLTGRTNF